MHLRTAVIDDEDKKPKIDCDALIDDWNDASDDFNDAFKDYDSNPTKANCNKVKAATQDYIDAIEEAKTCEEIVDLVEDAGWDSVDEFIEWLEDELADPDFC